MLMAGYKLLHKYTTPTPFIRPERLYMHVDFNFAAKFQIPPERILYNSLGGMNKKLSF